MTEQHHTTLTPEEQGIESDIHELAMDLTHTMVKTVRDQILARGVKVAAPALSIALGRTFASVVCTIVNPMAREALLEMHKTALNHSMERFSAVMAEVQESLNA